MFLVPALAAGDGILKALVRASGLSVSAERSTDLSRAVRTTIGSSANLHAYALETTLTTS